MTWSSRASRPIIHSQAFVTSGTLTMVITYIRVATAPKVLKLLPVILALPLWNVGIGVDLVDAGDRARVSIVVEDALGRSAHPVRIAARVWEVGLLGVRGVGGERLSLLVNGTEVASSLTGGDGRAYFEFEPRRLGLFPMTVVLKDSPRVQDAEGTGILAVWERRRPVLLVEQAVLLADSPAGLRQLAAPSGRQFGDPSAGAADALTLVGKFYFNLVYLIPAQVNGTDMAVDFHKWLDANGFPPGVVVSVSSTAPELEAFVGTLKEDGWENVKAGVGASPAFAQALVAQRLKVAIKTDRPREDFPRRAKVVNDWLGVRKQLQD